MYRSHCVPEHAGSGVGLVFLRLESPSWQNVIQHRTYWFPHIASRRPRLADGLRYLLQGIWLLLVRPDSADSEKPKPVSKTPGWLGTQKQRYRQWLDILPENVKKIGWSKRLLHGLADYKNALAVFFLLR